MSHWGGDSDTTYTDSDFETDSEELDYINTDTERIGDSDSEVIEFDIDASSGDETETDEEVQSQELRREAPQIRRTCTLVQGLCTTGVQPRRVEVLGLHSGGDHQHEQSGELNMHERTGARVRSQSEDRTKSHL